MRAVTRRMPLRRADLDDGTCPVPDEVMAALAGQEIVAVMLEHRERGLTFRRHVFEAKVEDAPTGVTWPEDLHPGVIVAVTWRPARGDLAMRTTALDEPMRIDGTAYYHKYDPAAVTRESKPGASNRGQVLHAIRTLGRVYDDGSAVFPEADLGRRAGLGRGAKGTFLLRNAIQQLIREGYVTRVTGSVDADGGLHYPPAEDGEPADLLFYAPLIEPAPVPVEEHDSEASDRRDHWVSGFFRKLPPGTQPSPKALALYQSAVDAGQITGTLPTGYTFVKKHHRNG